jgi:hypothetical protein
MAFFVWACRALNSQKRRFSARAVNAKFLNKSRIQWEGSDLTDVFNCFDDTFFCEMWPGYVLGAHPVHTLYTIGYHPNVFVLYTMYVQDEREHRPDGAGVAQGESVIWTDNDSNDSKVTMQTPKE